MKKVVLLILLWLSFLSCRRDRECAVTVVNDPDNVLVGIIDPNNPIIEILDCNCLNKTITEIERNLDYSIDSLNGRDVNVEYNIECD